MGWLLLFFFFSSRRRHTRCLSDWSSDVCSSDLPAESRSGMFVLRLTDDERVRTRSVVVATGARYRRLEVEDLPSFEGSSVHYWVSPLEARLCAGQEVAVVGGGNSAGQAVVYLATVVSKVWLLLRGKDLGASMSSYLVHRISATSNVEVV